MNYDSKKQLVPVRGKKYLNKDFAGLKSDILEYARTYFPNANTDYSEASLGGLFLDMASMVGDVQSFYLDHQFHEIDPVLATENTNIERHLRRAGVPIVGSSPAVVGVTFLIEVPASGSTNPIPDPTALPVIEAGSICKADNGVFFELVDSVDFSETDELDELVATIQVATRNAQSVPTSFFLRHTGICISGFRATESFSVGSFQPFIKFSLGKENITEIISVSDSENNTFYEVEYLSQDTVYKASMNRNEDNHLVQDVLSLVPAPYRFIKTVDLTTRLTSLTFGGGSATTLDNDIIPDPSDFSLPLYGKRNFSRFSIDPGNLLQTQTLGAIVPNTTITVTYRHGGGLSHNVIARSIRDIPTLLMSFPGNPEPRVAQTVRATTSVINERDAAGGEDPPTPTELQSQIPAFRATQSRIVSKPDALVRIYTMPSNFGRVFRAAIHPNPNNPLAARLFIISRNSQGQLIISPDTLKQNLAKYLNTYRLISDSIDILDASVVNVKLNFSIVVNPTQAENKNLIVQSAIKNVRKYFEQRKFDIDQPIVIDNIRKLISDTSGVVSIASFNFSNVHGTTQGTTGSRTYSTTQYDLASNTDRGIIFGQPGSIFEVRYPEFDIVGSAT